MLSAKEKAAFADLAIKSLDVKSLNTFADWCRNDVRRFMDFGLLICATGRTYGGMVVLDNVYGVEYTRAQMYQMECKTCYDERKVVHNWLNTRQPQLIDHNNYHTALSAVELEEYKNFAQENIAAHGIIEPDGGRGSYFSFSRLPEAEMEMAKVKLALLVPYMHQLYSWLCWAKRKKRLGTHQYTCLTHEELEILCRLLEGKDQSQIVSMLEGNLHTMEYHIDFIMRELGVKTRAQAAAHALKLGIFPMGVMNNSK